jgi:hypothetical protein
MEINDEVMALWPDGRWYAAVIIAKKKGRGGIIYLS